VQRLDWDGNLLWEYVYSDSTKRHHHDIAALPNGNVLVLAWELKSTTEAIAQGRDPLLLFQQELWPEHIVEVQPVLPDSGVIVWEWHVWDHLVQDYDSTRANFGVVADHPELIDINFLNGGLSVADWLHANAIAYNEELDQIAISLNSWSEVWIIDHSTTTAEAAGHTGGNSGKGGDLLYRWGNPEAYDRGTATERKLYRQHDVQWIPEGSPGAGNLLVFNNGWERPEGAYSSVEEIQTPVDSLGNYAPLAPGVPHGPASTVWTYTATPPESLYASFISGAQRLPNGNTLICEGAPSGTLQEVDPSDSLVWIYVNPVNSGGPMVQGTVPTGNLTFRTIRYAPEFPGLAGRDLTPGLPVELPAGTGVNLFAEAGTLALRQNYPNPAVSSTRIAFSLAAEGEAVLEVFDVGGRRVATLVDGRLPAGDHVYAWRPEALASGVYHYRLQVGGESVTRRMVVLR
ncbi:MAG: T9SS type A sorting domain-containing protein, partial [Gemmatimonadetes bacterium]|nr:T9SS type A sorting domain-containing protein [Gemmatimonadota bacterium]